MGFWSTDPALATGWFARATRLVTAALVFSGGVSLALIQYVAAVFWFEGRNERELARQGIFTGGDALNAAVVPAFWLTLVVVIVEVAAVVLLVHVLRRRRAARSLD